MFRKTKAQVAFYVVLFPAIFHSRRPGRDNQMESVLLPVVTAGTVGDSGPGGGGERQVPGQRSGVRCQMSNFGVQSKQVTVLHLLKRIVGTG